MTTNSHPGVHDGEADTLLDSRAIGELRRMEQDLGPGLIAELIDIYLADTPGRLAALAAAARAGDGDELAEQAHALRSSCAQLGARSMAALCRRLEDASRPGRPLDGPRLVAALQHEFERLRPPLLAERGPAD